MTLTLTEQYEQYKPKARCDSCVFFRDAHFHNLGDSGYPNIKGMCGAGVRPITFNLYHACEEAYEAIPREQRAQTAEERLALYEARVQKENDVNKVRIVGGDEAAELLDEPTPNQEIADALSMVSVGEVAIIDCRDVNEAERIQKAMTVIAEYAGWRKGPGDNGVFTSRVREDERGTRLLVRRNR